MNFLNKEETAEFLQLLKDKNFSNEEFSRVIGVSEPSFFASVKDLKVPETWLKFLNLCKSK